MTQNNSTVSGPMQKALDGDWWDLVTLPLTDGPGTMILAIFIVAIIVLPTYLRTDSIALPSVLLVLFSGSLIPMLPAGLQSIAFGVVWLSGALAIVGVIRVIQR